MSKIPHTGLKETNLLIKGYMNSWNIGISPITKIAFKT